MTTGIDVHAHVFPGSILGSLRTSAPAGMDYDPDSRVLTFPSGPSRPLFDELLDMEARRAWNAERGIEVQVVSPWMDVAGDDLEGESASQWARLCNDGVADELGSDPHFRSFAVLPVRDPVASAEELRRCVMELSFVGAALPTQIAGQNLSERGLDPLFEAAVDLDVPLFLHPFRVLGAERLGRDFMNNICGNPFETTVAAMSLFFAGVPERYPGLKILLSHCGGALPFIAGRAAHASRNSPQVGRRMEAPEEMLGAFFYDTIVHDPDALAFALQKIGPARCALGSDVPFPMWVDRPVEHVLEALELAGLGNEAEAVLRTTPEALCGTTKGR